MPTRPKPASSRSLSADQLSHRREAAWQAATYEKAQRDEYTSKIRFGVAALNAASLVTVLNASGLLNAVEEWIRIVSAGAFLVGTCLAGFSLWLQQQHLIHMAGNTSVAAMLYDRIIMLLESEDATPGAVDKAFDELDAASSKIWGLSTGGFIAQNFSQGFWLFGALLLALSQIGQIWPVSAEPRQESPAASSKLNEYDKLLQDENAARREQLEREQRAQKLLEKYRHLMPEQSAAGADRPIGNQAASAP